MRNIKNHTRVSVIRSKFKKSIDGTCRLYSPLQKKFAELLDADENVASFETNVVVEGLDGDEIYTTDFVVNYKNETTKVWECVFRRHITKPKTMRMLSLSKNYWTKKGCQWGLVTEVTE